VSPHALFLRKEQHEGGFPCREMDMNLENHTNPAIPQRPRWGKGRARQFGRSSMPAIGTLDAPPKGMLLTRRVSRKHVGKFIWFKRSWLAPAVWSASPAVAGAAAVMGHLPGGRT